MNNKAQEIRFKAKLYCGSTFGQSTEATLNLEGSGVHHSDLAAFVTKAVNCHDDLLEACKAMLEAMKWQQKALAERGEPVLVWVGMAMQQCDKAIEKASAQ